MLHLQGVSEIVYLKKPHKWTEELRIRQRKDYSMDHCGTEALQFKMAGRRRPLLPLDVAQHCSVLVFPLLNFILLNKILGYLLAYL